MAAASGSVLPTGKLPRPLLEALLRYRGAPDQRVVYGPGFGRDAAVVDCGDRLLVLKSDPVTFVGDEAGWYAVHVNANDVAVLGCQPAWFQVTLLLPVGTESSVVRRIMRDVHSAAKLLGIAVTGGHTEVTPAACSPIVVGDMQGLARKAELVTPAGARAGDLVVCTKFAGLEGTAILARAFPAVAERILGTVKARKAARLHRNPGISVVAEALLAARSGASAMHDSTEGGVRAALAELASASGRGLEVDLDAIPRLPETTALCDHFGIDPLGLLSSGMLLATLPGEVWPVLERTWRRRGVLGHCIGRVTPRGGVRVRQQGKRVPWHWSERDELARVFERHASHGRPRAGLPQEQQ